MSDTKETREMVRFGRGPNGERKNVLWTLRKNGLVYFGVARCRTKTDKFDKELGVEIAKGRALKVCDTLTKSGSFEVYPGAVNFFNGDTKGYIALQDIRVLLSWFKQFN
jgi:hypothetical protein